MNGMNPPALRPASFVENGAMADSVLPADLLEQALVVLLRLMPTIEPGSEMPDVSIDLVTVLARVVDAMEQMAYGFDAVPASSVLH